MSVLDTVLPWRSTQSEDEDSGRPPKPEGEEKGLTKELTRHEVTIEYRNGDTESFEAFNVYSRDKNSITYNLTAHPSVSFYDNVRIGYDRRTVNYEVLAREPVMEELETVEYRVTWETEWEWKKSRHGITKEWVETVDRDSLEMEVVE